MKKTINKQKARTFLLWYTCIMLIAGTIVSAFFFNQIRSERESYSEGLKQQVNRIADYFARNFQMAVSSGAGIFSARWYQHYRTQADIYAHEFDTLKRLEICSEIAVKVTALSYISDILVINPPPFETVICKNGWFSFKDYGMIYGAVSIEYPDGDYTRAPAVTAVGDNICVITLQDVNSRLLKSAVSLIVDKNQFARAFQQAMPSDALYAGVLLEGQSLFESGVSYEWGDINKAVANNPRLELTIASPGYEDAHMRATVVNYALLLAVILLLGAGFAAIATIVDLNPLKRTVRYLGGDYRKENDPYRFILQSMETISESAAKLSSENEALNRTVGQFLKQMRNEILFGMLTNPDVDYGNEYVRSCIPWIDEGRPFILAILEPALPSNPRWPDFNPLAERALYCCPFNVLGDICAFLWYNETDIYREAGFLEEELRRLASGTEFQYAVSPVMLRPEEMRGVYGDLKTSLEDKKSIRSSLPVSAQIEFLGALQSGNPLQCTVILNELRKRNEPHQVFTVLLGAAKEYDLPNLSGITARFNREKKAGNADAQWNLLGTLAAEACSSIAQNKQENVKRLAGLIRLYINENYRDPDMCMKKLSDQFGLHRTLISKILKAHAEIVFSDYLENLRLNKAVEMMENPEIGLSDIAESVGYINYLTFKRAFTRRHGSSPSAYRLKLNIGY